MLCRYSIYDLYECNREFNANAMEPWLPKRLAAFALDPGWLLGLWHYQNKELKE